MGELIFVSGTTGYDYECHVIPEDVGEQTRAALASIDTALRNLGGSLRGVVQTTVYFTNADDYSTIGAIYGEVFAEARPTNTAVTARFVKPEMKIEISAIAIAGAGNDTA